MDDVEDAASAIDDVVEQYVGMVRTKDEAIVHLLAQVSALQAAYREEVDRRALAEERIDQLQRALAQSDKALSKEKKIVANVQSQLDVAHEAVASLHVALMTPLLKYQPQRLNASGAHMPPLATLTQIVDDALAWSASQRLIDFQVNANALASAESRARGILAQMWREGMFRLVCDAETGLRQLLIENFEQSSGSIARHCFGTHTGEGWPLRVAVFKNVAMLRQASNSARDLARHLGAAQHLLERAETWNDFSASKLGFLGDNTVILHAAKLTKDAMLREHMAAYATTEERAARAFLVRRNEEMMEQIRDLGAKLSASRSALQKLRSTVEKSVPSSHNVSVSVTADTVPPTDELETLRAQLTAELEKRRIERQARELVQDELRAVSVRVAQLSKRGADMERSWKAAEDRIRDLENELKLRAVGHSDEDDGDDAEQLEACVASVAQLRGQVRSALD